MKHMEAVERLKELANGRAWALEHEIASFLPESIKISAYIDGIGHCFGPTYALAIGGIEYVLEIKKKEVVPDPAPEDEGEEKERIDANS